MIGISQQRLVRIAAVGALVATLGLSACGRKGGLDLPPGAAPQAAAPDQSTPAPVAGAAPRGSQTRIDGRNFKPTAPPPSGRREPFILDWLLN